MHYDNRTNLIWRDGEWLPSNMSDLRKRETPISVGTATALREGPAAGVTTEGREFPLAPPSRFRSLLVPVDGSPFGEHALPFALEIARRANAEVRVVHVHRPVPPDDSHGLRYPTALDLKARWRRLSYLDELQQRLARVTSVRVTPVLAEGPEVAEVLSEAVGTETDLVVMATRGRGPLRRLWDGSVTDALMRRVSVPILFVRGHDAPAELSEDRLVRHVLIPLDGSEAAERILEPACAMGALWEADSSLLRVLPLVQDYSVGYPTAGAREPRWRRQQNEATAYLRRVAASLEERADRVRVRLNFSEGATAEAILRHAKTHDVDLIATTTRGRGGLSRLLRGSVTDQLLRTSHVPVLVVRADQAREEVIEGDEAEPAVHRPVA